MCRYLYWLAGVHESLNQQNIHVPGASGVDGECKAVIAAETTLLDDSNLSLLIQKSSGYGGAREVRWIEGTLDISESKPGADCNRVPVQAISQSRTLSVANPRSEAAKNPTQTPEQRTDSVLE